MSWFAREILPLPAFIAALFALRALVRFAAASLDRYPAYHTTLRVAPAPAAAAGLAGCLGGGPAFTLAGCAVLIATVFLRAGAL
jgi:hypothetical protein